ncbi:hypothetical protein [Rufibacter immobilis]|uniref:hypothetical protein n=1 Tax=Rufibacter immobilis TaxID=1348778 RepID=UPI0035EF5826
MLRPTALHVSCTRRWAKFKERIVIQSKYIRDILTLLLDGDPEGLAAKKQLDYIRENKSNYTGAGVFVSFEHLQGIVSYKTENKELILDGVIINSPELNIGAIATLFFKDGLADYLEIWSYDGEYPEKELRNYELKQEWNESPNRKTINN